MTGRVFKLALAGHMARLVMLFMVSAVGAGISLGTTAPAYAASTCGSISPPDAQVVVGQWSHWQVDLTSSCNTRLNGWSYCDVYTDFGDGTGLYGSDTCANGGAYGDINHAYSTHGKYTITAYLQRVSDGAYIYVDQTTASAAGSPTVGGLTSGPANPCVIDTQTPHVSTTSGFTEIDKANTTCYSSHVTQVQLNIYLFKCPAPPWGTESDWPGQGCAQVGHAADQVNSPQSGRKYVSLPAVTPNVSGWYIGCTVWTVVNDDATVWQGTSPSQAAGI